LPAPSRATAQETIESLKRVGINGVLALGNTSESISQIAIGLNRVGMVLLGGLNPVAAACEAGLQIENIGESGMVEYDQLVNFQELQKGR
jgi:hypothetical protein